MYAVTESDKVRIRHIYELEITEEALRNLDVTKDTASTNIGAEEGPKNLIVGTNASWLVWDAYGSLRLVRADLTAVPELKTMGVTPEVAIVPNRLASDMMPVLPYMLIGAAILAGGYWWSVSDPDRYDLRKPLWTRLRDAFHRRKDIL